MEKYMQEIMAKLLEPNLVFLKFVIAASMFFSCSNSKVPFMYEAYACKTILSKKLFNVSIVRVIFSYGNITLKFLDLSFLKKKKGGMKHTSASKDVLESPFREHKCEKSVAHLTAFLNLPNM